MNRFYSIENAKSKVKAITSTAEHEGGGHIRQLVADAANDAIVKTFEFPPSIRLVTATPTEDTGEDEQVEVVLILQAVLCGVNTPPVRNAAGKSVSQLRNLRQHVKLTAFGAAEFDKAMANIEDIHRRFQEHIPTVEVLPFSFLPYEGYPCIETHARYFTDRGLVPFDKNEPFADMVDPLGVLASVQPDIFIHGPDNIVEYCQKVDADGKPKYKAFDPSKFKAGDIVEVSFSFTAVPVQGNKYRPILNLKALTLIDASLRKAAELVQTNALRPTPTTSPSKLKRKRLFLEAEEEASPTHKQRTNSVDAAGGSGSKMDVDNN